ncbi:MAG: NrtA/SsuA/CpmA family ABC transporter substrate-binding protein [Thiohalomonadaceae bacterium]
MKRRWLAVPLAIALATLIAVLHSLWVGERRPPSTDSAVLALPLHPSSVVAFVALDRGYFEARGLDVRVELYPSGKVALEEGLFPGRADIAWSHEVPIALAGFERADFAILASELWADNVNRIVARRDRGIGTPTDLRGKRVATQSASAVHYFLHLFLLRHGMTEADITLTFLKADDLTGALTAGEIDAFSMREPYIGEAATRLGENAVVFEEAGIYEQAQVLVARRAVLEENPRIARKALEALLDAEAFVARNPRESAIISARYLDTTVASMEAQLATFRIQVALPQALFILLESEARWAFEAGLVNRIAIPNYLRLIETGPLEALKPEAVTLIR